jgi:hypothetical protein
MCIYACQLPSSSHQAVPATYLSREWDQMMLAEGEDLNVLDDNELIVIFMEDGAIDNVSEVLLIALGKEEHSLGVPLGRLEDTLSVRIFTHTFENSPDSAGELGKTLRPLLFTFFLALSRSQA